MIAPQSCASNIQARIVPEYSALATTRELRASSMKFIKEVPSLLRRITTSGAYKPEIDGLRFWAILPVVLWHGIQRVSRAQPSLTPDERSWMLWIPEAWVGVVLFLTISGFIISSQFIRSHATGRPLNLGSYFYRRVTRIEPPYLLLLLASYLFLTLSSYQPVNAVAFWRGPESLTESFLASIFYLHGIIYNEMPRVFPGGWSLEVEVQFYVIAPALFASLFLARTVRQQMIVTLIVLIATFAISQYFDAAFGSKGPHRYTLIKYFFYFWVGVLIAQINNANNWPRWNRETWDILGFSALIAYLCSGTAQHSTWWPESALALLDVLRILAFILMFGGALNGHVFAKLNALPWICLIGGACYSIYLTHVQVMQLSAPIVASLFQPASLGSAVLLNSLLLLPFVLITGLIFYALVERPFMIPRWPEKLVAWIGRKFRRSVPTEPV
jgi:peptidoglycan/LPS O-acetylase OafA/YrhL